MRKGDRVRHIHTRMTGTIVEQVISGFIWWIDILWDGGLKSRTHHKFIEPLPIHEDPSRPDTAG